MISSRTIVLFLSIGIVLFIGCDPQAKVPAIGEPTPVVVLPDLEGNSVNLSDFHGKVVLINFWATWCPSCIVEMPSLEKLHQALEAKGLHVVAVSVDDNLADIKQFQQEHQLTFPILHDLGGRVSTSFNTFKYPETYVLDREGNLAWKIVGPLDWISPRVIHDFVELLKSEQLI